jgi:transmembrane sensor
VTDDLIERALRGEATEAEVAELTSWCRQSEENQREYERLARILQAARAIGSPRVVPAPSASAILARSADRGAVRSRLRTSIPWAIAAAAVVIATLSVWQPRIGAEHPTEIVTGSSELATVHLRDGSVVRLAPSSRLRIHDHALQRDLSLDGRAFFAVARMPGRQFLVRTSHGVVREHGTRFELTSRADTTRLRVVDDSVASDIAWVGTFLGFQATPLVNAAREIERVYHARVMVEDSALRRETITATFTDRPLDDVVRVVCSVLGARCSIDHDTVRITRRPAS